MSITKRRFLYIFFILAFLIITPLLILYALGYSLGSGFKLTKSGILIIDTEPKGATIIINEDIARKFWGKILNNPENYVKTPAKIKNLKPGEYDIRVELPGYWPWTKKLTISSGMTTFAEDIYLFKDNEPALIKEANFKQTSFSPNKKYFVDASNDKIEILNLENQQQISANIIATSGEPLEDKDFIWSSDDKNFLNSNLIFAADNLDNQIAITKIIGENYNKYLWDNNNNANSSIIYSQQNKLFAYNTNTNTNEEILTLENIENFTSIEHFIYLTSRDQGNIILSAFDRSTKEIKSILQLPISNYNFINPDHNLLNVFDSSNNILYLIDTNSSFRPLLDVVYGTEETQWVTSSRLLYSTSYEIWLLDLNTLERKLLIRISDKITNLAWHPSNNYIVFSTANDINILELDSREKYSITKITERANIDKMILDKKGEIIYFNTLEDGNDKLYKMFIQ